MNLMATNAPKNSDLVVKTNQELKEEADKILHNIGLDMDTAINMMLIQIINQKRLPFEAKDEMTYEEQIEKLEEELEKGLNSFRKGEGVSAKDFLASLKGNLNG